MNEIITKLRKLNVELRVVSGKLRINSPEGVMTKELLEEIKCNKSSLIEYIESISSKKEINSIQKACVKNYYPLSSAQKRLYFLFELDKSSMAYNMPYAFKLDGKLDHDRLNNSIKKLIERHENLRVKFKILEERAVQEISNHIDFEIEYFYLNETDISSIVKDFIRPFDLNKGPLIRVGLIKISPTEHILLIDLHHIISDGVSQGLLIKEFISLYNNEIIPDQIYQYKDFAEWQQSEEQQIEIAKQKDFWIKEFADEVSILELPTDYPRPLLMSHQGDSLRFSIGVEETRSLELIAKKEKTTMFMVMLSIFNILLSKLGNQEDVVVGTPVSGRQHADLENIIGMFVNTLPLRNFPKGELSFSEFLSNLSIKVLTCFDNQAFQFEELIEALNVERDMSHNPLFDVLFSYQNFEKPEFYIPGLKLENYSLGHDVSKFDIILTVTDVNEQIFFNLQYSTSLFKEETIERIIGYYKKVITTIIADPNVKISAIEIVNEEEKKQLLYLFNNTLADYPRDKTIFELFDDQAHRIPIKLAVKYEMQEICYGDLRKRVDSLALYLKQRGVISREVIVTLIDRSPDFIVSILAILKNGGVYIPIDPKYPDDRINFIIYDSGTKYILTKEYIVSKKNIRLPLAVIKLDNDKNEIDSNLGINPNIPIYRDKNTYIIYTSGSTGKPKGVLGNQQGLINRLTWGWNSYPYAEDEVCCQKSNIGFVSHVAEIFSPLLKGIPLIIFKDNDVIDIERMTIQLIENRISRITLVSSLLQSIIEVKKNKNLKMDALKTVFCSGEILTLQLVKDFYKEFGNVKFVNIYGSSEVTADVSFYNLDFEEKNYKYISIGEPINNIQILILDKYNNLQPIGVAGEICISGDGLTFGYLNRAELTSDKFIRSTYYGNSLIHKTGDVGRWLADGNIEFLGRVDNQIKIRGYRIELGEIENLLTSHNQVKESLVLTKGSERDKYLVAYYVSEIEISTSEFRAFLLDKLPDYMIPVYYVRLRSIPLTPNGKIDRKSLPEPEIISSDEIVKPVNRIQRDLIEIWASVLGIEPDKIGINMNFFEIGGNSLKLITMVNKVNQRFSKQITVANMFKFPVISQLAAYINNEDDQPVESINNDGFMQMDETIKLLDQIVD